MVMHESKIYPVTVVFRLLGTSLIAKSLVSLMAHHEEFLTHCPGIALYSFILYSLHTGLLTVAHST